MKICVVGLGVVGIPVAAKLAEAGHAVVGIDVDKRRAQAVDDGIYPLSGAEPGLQKLLKKAVGSGRLSATTDFGGVRTADAVLVCVQTPFSGTRPDYAALESAAASVGKNLRRKSLVIVESTIAPTTMQKTVIPILEKNSGLRAGRDFYVAHCPERVMPGRLLNNLENCSRVIGGIDGKSAEIARELYKNIVSADLDTTDLVTAELVKTVENAYRFVQIGFANEVALICEKLGANAFEVRKLVNKCPSRDLHLPGLGIGGHCIPKDYLLLMYGAGMKTPVLEAARQVNENMPRHAFELASRVLGRLEDKKVAVLGLAYIPNCGDTRNSPVFPLAAQLEKAGAKVSVYDPFVRTGIKKPAGSVEDALKNADCLVLATAHSSFEKLRTQAGLSKIKKLMRTKFILDGRNFFDKKECERAGFKYAGIGNGALSSQA